MAAKSAFLLLLLMFFFVNAQATVISPKCNHVICLFVCKCFGDTVADPNAVRPDDPVCCWCPPCIPVNNSDHIRA